MKICSRCKHTFESETYKTCEACRKAAKERRKTIKRSYRQGQYSSKDGKTKTCRDCNKQMQLSRFYKLKKMKDGYRSECIECHSKRWKKYYKKTYNKVLKKKLQEDDMFRKTQNLKSLIHYHLKSADLIKSDKTLNYIGCTKQKLRAWFEFQNNHWHYKIYHIDHILPMSLFDLTDDDHQKIAFHWTNLQPLYGTANNQKYNNIRQHEYYNKLLQVHRFDNLSDDDQKVLKLRHKWFQQYCNTSKLQETP